MAANTGDFLALKGFPENHALPKDFHSSIPFLEASYLVPIGRLVPAPLSAYLAQALTASPSIGSVGWSTYFLELIPLCWADSSDKPPSFYLLPGSFLYLG